MPHLFQPRLVSVLECRPSERDDALPIRKELILVLQSSTFSSDSGDVGLVMAVGMKWGEKMLLKAIPAVETHFLCPLLKSPSVFRSGVWR